MAQRTEDLDQRKSAASPGDGEFGRCSAKRATLADLPRRGLPRSIEVTLALAGLILLSPLVFVAALALSLEMRTPALFRQVRVGKDRRLFVLYKLRTMRPETPEAPTHLVGGSAVTKFGGLARRTKIDELPQLWNVVRGDMSLVGPRPCLPSQSKLIEAREAANVFAVRPGITGLAQAQGVDMSDPLLLASIDGTYVRTRSPSADLRLLRATLFGAGLGKDFVAGINHNRVR
ncbi:MAG: sugar transferase [Hyphomicrobiaceae bacterium]